jgi:hypothetical protein
MVEEPLHVKQLSQHHLCKIGLRTNCLFFRPADPIGVSLGVPVLHVVVGHSEANHVVSSYASHSTNK